MPSRFFFKLAAVGTVIALIAAAAQVWRAERRASGKLATELAATKQLLAAADARQHDRDAQLTQTLSALEAQKRAVLTPAQIVSELAKRIPLPEPVTLNQAPNRPSQSRGTIPRSPSDAPANAAANLANNQTSQATGSTTITETSTQLGAPPQAVIPRADLKPLYDFTLDCQACQAKLSTAQSDLADERSKTAALTKERDDAVRIAKGGSAWRRFAHTAKWFLLGAAAGAIAAKTR